MAVIQSQQAMPVGSSARLSTSRLARYEIVLVWMTGAARHADESRDGDRVAVTQETHMGQPPSSTPPTDPARLSLTPGEL
jgi:hypothetical protein